MRQEAMEAFIRRLADLLDKDPAELAPDTELAQFNTWDSLAAVSVTAMADVEYDRKLTAAAILSCRTVRDLYDLCDGES